MKKEQLISILREIPAECARTLARYMAGEESADCSCGGRHCVGPHIIIEGHESISAYADGGLLAWAEAHTDPTGDWSARGVTTSGRRWRIRPGSTRPTVLLEQGSRPKSKVWIPETTAALKAAGIRVVVR